MSGAKTVRGMFDPATEQGRKNQAMWDALADVGHRLRLRESALAAGISQDLISGIDRLTREQRAALFPIWIGRKS